VTDGFWSLDRVATALRELVSGARPTGRTPLGRVWTDTRSIQAGDCFVALQGERFDAHDFLPAAVESGASALVVSRPATTAGLGVPVYVVPDTLEALGRLAAFRRSSWGKTVVGVAGSNGKTTSKELIRAALGTTLTVHATTGNLNNLIGVPQTLLSIPDEADVAVVEMGMNVPGEMDRLQAMTRPDIAVVTCVAEEHLEGLGSIEGVLREESIAFRGACVGIAPATQPEVVDAAKRLASRAVSAGLESGDLRAERWGLDGEGRGWMEVAGVRVALPVRGRHNLQNAMLALAVAAECGVSLADAASGLANTTIPGMRVQLESHGDATLVNDAYNASPASMRAALDLLGALDASRQRVAVLGTMRELGSHSDRLHDEVARYALASAADVIAAQGEMAAALRRVGGDGRVIGAAELDELWRQLEPRLRSDAIILLKASRGVRLERLVPNIAAWAQRSCSPNS